MKTNKNGIIAAAPPRLVVIRSAWIDEDPVAGGGLYLAFGSNLSVEQMEERAPGFRTIERVLIAGQRLAFGGRNNVATLVADGGFQAAGVVYWMSEADFEVMDKSEGVVFSTKKYRRLRVDLDGYGPGRPVYTYLLREGETEGAVPSKRYSEKILRGMDYWEFDAQAYELRRLCVATEFQPYESYGGIVTVVAEPEVRTVFDELREMQDDGDREAYVGFFYGIFTNAATRATYGLGVECCKAKLLNMRRCSGMPASTEYAAGSSVSGVLAVVPGRSVAALDEVEGAPGWYRRELVPIEVETDGVAERCSVRAQYYQMNIRDNLRP